MSNVIFESAAIYIDSATTLKEKITKVQAVINALMDTALKSASSDHLKEYTLNDGQTQIKASYKGTDAIFASIRNFERLKQMYVNQLTGRMVRLVDGKNFRR